MLQEFLNKFVISNVLKLLLLTYPWSDLGFSLKLDFLATHSHPEKVSNKQVRGIQLKLKMSVYLNRVQKRFFTPTPTKNIIPEGPSNIEKFINTDKGFVGNQLTETN